jgi:excisionase family DNA binding protein
MLACAGHGTSPLAVSVKECCKLTSLSRTTCFQLIREKELEVRRIGGRTLVLMRSIHALLGINEHSGERS